MTATTARRDDQARLEPVVLLAEVEHELQRADQDDQQDEADDVDRRRLTSVVLDRLSIRQRERRADERHRHIDEEDQWPAIVVAEPAAEDRAEDRRDQRRHRPERHRGRRPSPSGRCAAAASATAASAGRRRGPAGCGRTPACRARSPNAAQRREHAERTMAVVKTRTAPKRPASQPVSGTVIASATA